MSYFYHVIVMESCILITLGSIPGYILLTMYSRYTLDTVPAAGWVCTHSHMAAKCVISQTCYAQKVTVASDRCQRLACIQCDVMQPRSKNHYVKEWIKNKGECCWMYPAHAGIHVGIWKHSQAAYQPAGCEARFWALVFTAMLQVFRVQPDSIPS